MSRIIAAVALLTLHALASLASLWYIYGLWPTNMSVWALFQLISLALMMLGILNNMGSK